MAAFCWILHDAAGADMRSTHDFPSREDAEEWMGREWQSLLDEGAESASLVRDARVLYRMGLREA